MGNETRSRILVDAIEWEYPATRRGWEPVIQDLLDASFREFLFLGFANGIFLEFRLEAESEEVLQAIYAFLDRMGGVKPASFTEGQKQALWLYQEGDLCWTQTNMGQQEPFAYIMIAPQPHPEKFPEKASDD
jgi:hypothetical protein